MTKTYCQLCYHRLASSCVTLCICLVSSHNEDRIQSRVCALLSLPWVCENKSLSAYKSSGFPSWLPDIAQRLSFCYCEYLTSLVTCIFFQQAISVCKNSKITSNGVFLSSTWDPGRLCVAPGPPASWCVCHVARVCLFQDVAERRWGGESGSSRGISSSSSPPGKETPQPHRDYSAVSTCKVITSWAQSQTFVVMIIVCVLQFQAGGQFGEGEDRAGQDRRSAELYPVRALPAQWHPRRVQSSSWDPLPPNQPSSRACWEHLSIPQGEYCQTLPATAQKASSK